VAAAGAAAALEAASVAVAAVAAAVACHGALAPSVRRQRLRRRAQFAEKFETAQRRAGCGRTDQPYVRRIIAPVGLKFNTLTPLSAAGVNRIVHRRAITVVTTAIHPYHHY
jgi:hypothetical protein